MSEDNLRQRAYHRAAAAKEKARIDSADAATARRDAMLAAIRTDRASGPAFRSLTVHNVPAQHVTHVQPQAAISPLGLKEQVQRAVQARKQVPQPDSPESRCSQPQSLHSTRSTTVSPQSLHSHASAQCSTTHTPLESTTNTTQPVSRAVACRTELIQCSTFQLMRTTLHSGSPVHSRAFDLPHTGYCAEGRLVQGQPARAPSSRRASASPSGRVPRDFDDFDDLDRNRDGVIDRQELEAHIGTNAVTATPTLLLCV